MSDKQMRTVLLKSDPTNLKLRNLDLNTIKGRQDLADLAFAKGYKWNVAGGWYQ